MRTPVEERRLEIVSSIIGFRNLEVVKAAKVLAEAFIDGNLVPAKKTDDALHLALAVHFGMDYLVSWNFQHMVHVRTKKKLPVLAAGGGYFKYPLIVSPQEFLEELESPC